MNFVCMITQSNYPADPRVRRQAEVLEKAGYEVDIICLPQRGQSRVESFGKITAIRILTDKRSETISTYLLQSIFFFIRAFFKLQQLSFFKRYDLIQIHNMPDWHVFTAVFHKIAKVPVILDIHDLTPELFESKWEHKRKSLIFAIVKFAEKLSCSFADKVITVTEGCKELLVKRGVPPEKITVILNTPDENIFKFDDTREFKAITNRLRILYHGTVAERFGIHLAVEAMKSINERIPGSTFNVYGKYDDSYKEFLKRQIAALGLENSVFLGGRHLLEDIYEFIQHSDIGVVPYMNNLYMNIALSTKSFEYAAAGLPVVATRLRTLALTLDDTTMTYSEPDSAKDLAEKIISLALNPERRKTQALNARKALSGISWRVMAKRYLNLIDTEASAKKSIRKDLFTKQSGAKRDFKKAL